MHYLHSLLGGGYDNDYHINNVAAEIAEDGRASPSVISPQSQVTKRVAKIVTTNPMLLQPDVCANLVPTVQFLVNLCDFTNDELAHVISAAPGILGLSVERNLRPTIDTLGDILREDCGNVGTSSSRSIRSVGNPGEDINEVFSKTLLGKCILKHPQILALLLDNLLAKRDYFNGIDNYREMRADANPERLEKEKSSLAARILISAPPTYLYSIKLTFGIKEIFSRADIAIGENVLAEDVMFSDKDSERWNTLQEEEIAFVTRISAVKHWKEELTKIAHQVDLRRCQQ